MRRCGSSSETASFCWKRVAHGSSSIVEHVVRMGEVRLGRGHVSVVDVPARSAAHGSSPRTFQSWTISPSVVISSDHVEAGVGHEQGSAARSAARGARR